MTAARRRFGLPPTTVHVESMDRLDLVIAALTRRPDIDTVLNFDDLHDEETCRKIGWFMAARTGTDFRIGRRLLQLLAPGGYLLPPKEFRLSRVTEPTKEEMHMAPLVMPCSIELWQSGSTPAEWRVGGSICYEDRPRRIWSRLLYLNRAQSMAVTDEGWVRLGKI